MNMNESSKTKSKAGEGRPGSSTVKREARTQAAAHIREMRHGNRLPVGVTIKDLINEGRA